MGAIGKQRSYDCAFKDRAVRLSRERDNIKELASESGISPERIYKWRAEFTGHGEGRGVERMGLRSKLSRKWWGMNYPEYLCPNHLDRQFNFDARGKVWMSDITCIHTLQGFRYLRSTCMTARWWYGVLAAI